MSRLLCRGRGDVACVACANGSVLVATSRGYLIRYAWDEYGNERVSEVEVTRQVNYWDRVLHGPRQQLQLQGSIAVGAE